MSVQWGNLYRLLAKKWRNENVQRCIDFNMLAIAWYNWAMALMNKQMAQA